MASWVGKPDAGAFPIGTAVHLYPRPTTPWSQEGKPPGSQITEANVASDGTLTFAGLTEGKSYLGWSERSGVSYYLNVSVPEAEAGAGAVSSVNGKTGAVTLTASDVEALGAASPALTGVPTAPTAAALTKTTQLATTAFTTDAVAVEKGRAEGAEVLKAPLASPALTGTPKSATTPAEGDNSTTLANTAYVDRADALKANLASPALTGVPKAPTASPGANSTQVATTAYADAVQAAAEAAGAAHLKVHASVTTNGTTATVNSFHPVDDTAETRTIKLPTGAAEGSRIGVEKSTAEAHEVEVEGNMRGVAAQTIKLRLTKQTVLFVADSAGSWWPIALFCPLSTLTTDTIQRTISVPAGQVPGNEQLAEWKIELQGTEKRTLIKARVRTTSGTINVAIKRGEPGTTEITAYKELKAASTEEIVTSEQALSNKDRITVTTSGGATPKGLFIDIWERVEK